MMVRQSYTAVIERNRLIEGEWASEPYECGWASEAIFFVRTLEARGSIFDVLFKVQISPDGIRWCDEGATLILSGNEVDFCRVIHFGNWLRLAGTLPKGVSVRLLVALSLKE